MEADAFYEEAVVTICYEYMADTWKAANSPKRPATVTRDDAFIGPFVDTLLHEAGHAMFDMLKVPVLGREEDAADQVAAYFVLQFPKERKRQLIMGVAFSYTNESPRCAGLATSTGRASGWCATSPTAASTARPHSASTIYCASPTGSDEKLFAQVVDYLPKKRAEMCEGEYLRSTTPTRR